ncbi:MAG: hypothetical protein IJ187_08350 [Neisseriaceae bacterium]|nr:hypothetical protein [Neisseriaceae bacterium]MBQ9725513.1 hypothetical protein [Neisseriaceae bacterium]
MNYATIERPYNTLTAEQQAIVYDLVLLSLANLNTVKTQPETAQNAHSDNLQTRQTLFLTMTGR